eukprot:GHVU01156763.1.p3 GENE.GHVU01156763.1~~GHVU01156763.1.p3  ORF type:complete len:163 (+),score=15.12 GHVU01156763.1:985-1473(+)
MGGGDSDGACACIGAGATIVFVYRADLVGRAARSTRERERERVRTATTTSLVPSDMVVAELRERERDGEGGVVNRQPSPADPFLVGPPPSHQPPVASPSLPFSNGTPYWKEGVHSRQSLAGIFGDLAPVEGTGGWRRSRPAAARKMFLESEGICWATLVASL